MTSSYGMRRHPILGFTRMHQGVDFAAREGAPVLAAADGVVTQAGPGGGYGNLLRIRHAGGWATGYAHLSAFAPGIAPGAQGAARRGDRPSSATPASPPARTCTSRSASAA